MNLQVIRHLEWSDAKATVGELFVDGEHAGYTLEPPKLEPPTKPRAIPLGTYDVEWDYSPKHGKFLPHVINVPGFEAIEIHVGNWPTDTEGCLLVGETRGQDMVGQSTAAITELYQKVQDACKYAPPVTITYTEAPSAP